MRSKSIVAHTLMLSLAIAGAASAVPVVINFDNLDCGVAVTSQYPEAAFSSDAGFENRTACDFNLGTSLPNYLCTASVGGALTCSNTTTVAFTDPVGNLMFYGSGDDNEGVTAQVDVYENNAFSATVDVITDAIFDSPHLVDLSAYTNVTSIVIRNITNGGGLAWDDFSFDTSPPTPTVQQSWGTLRSLYR